MNDETVFISGTIKNIEGSSINVNANDGVSKLLINMDSIIWKGGRGKQILDIKENDFFYARGKRISEDTLLVNIIWVNIVSIVSEVKECSGTTFTLATEEHQNNVVTFTPITELVKEGERSVQTLEVDNIIKTGDTVHIIGLLNQETNDIEATKIFTP